MEITIYQEPLTFTTGSRYTVKINNILKYIVKNTYYDYDPTTVYVLDEKEALIFQVTRAYSWFKSWVVPSFFIRYINGYQVDLNTISFLKRHFQAVDKSDIYDIYGHKGKKFSIYKNDIQIAKIVYKGFSILNENEYQISINNSENSDFIIAFCLMMDLYINEGHKSWINFTFGYLGFEMKKFDKGWYPN